MAMTTTLFPATTTNPLLLSSSTSYSTPLLLTTTTAAKYRLPLQPLTISSSHKIVRFPALDRRASSHQRLRFLRKLTSLLLSKPLHFLPLRVLRRCLPYLKPTRPLLPMLLRYPSLFRLLRTPSSLAVSLTPSALSLALHESSLRSRISSSLASKLHKLLLLSPLRRIPLSHLSHLAPDLGLPRHFRSSILPRFPDRFRIIPSSYGPVLTLVSFDPSLALPLPPPADRTPRPIIDRPLKFTRMRLRKGLNLKRRHAEYLERFMAMPVVNPYAEGVEEGLEERRACAVVREVLAMTVERRTLVDHLTHLRRDLGLPNKLRGMLVRHPEMFYISVKGKRDSVFLVEGYDEKGNLLEEDELVVAKTRLLELVRDGKRMRRERRRGIGHEEEEEDGSDDDDEEEWGLVDDEGCGGDLEDLFETGVGDDWEDWSGLGKEEVEEWGAEVGEFWSLKDGLNELDAW